MKQLLFIIIAVSLLVIAFFQYKEYKRHNPATEYIYEVNDSIDVYFYDQSIVQQYYENSFGIGSFARAQWKNHEIDVKYPGDDDKSQVAASHYNNMLGITKRLEDQLIHSARLKQKGFNNHTIKYIVDNGVSEDDHFYLANEQYVGLKIGDFGHEVWELQKLLNSMGNEIPTDGKFGLETENILLEYQNQNNLYPSGILDEKTIKKLF